KVKGGTIDLGGSWSFQHSAILSPKAKPWTGLHFAQCPAGGLKRPQMPRTEAVLLGHSRRGIRTVCLEPRPFGQFSDVLPDALRGTSLQATLRIRGNVNVNVRSGRLGLCGPGRRQGG